MDKEFEKWWDQKNRHGGQRNKLVAWMGWQAALKLAAEVCREKLREREKRLGIGGEYWDGYQSMAEDIAQAIERLLNPFVDN